MSNFEILVLTVFISSFILLVSFVVSTLQLIKQLKTSLQKLNKILENPQNINTQFTQRLADTLPPQINQTKISSPSRFFHRQKN